MISFQYISDTHFENYKLYPKDIIKKIDDCENICLLGDIGSPGSNNYNEFIKYCSKTWSNVFLLYGNHEYYQILGKEKKTMKEIDELVKELPINVYFLNNNIVYINKLTNKVYKNILNQSNNNDYIKIIGSTLWSDINLNIARLFNDYKFIYTSKQNKLTPLETKNFFNNSKKYILEELKEPIKCILLTHHGAHELTNGFYNGHFKQSGYATNIYELQTFDNLIACINGHTHSSINTIIPNTSIKLLSNCYGYKGEKKSIVKYNEYSMLEIY